MYLEANRCALAKSINTIRYDCDDIADQLHVLYHLIGVLDVEDDVDDFITLLYEADKRTGGVLGVSSTDIAILSLVCIMFTHIGGADFSEFIDDIHATVLYSRIPMLQFAAHITLATLGDPQAEHIRETAMRQQSIPTIYHHDMWAISELLDYLGQNS